MKVFLLSPYWWHLQDAIQATGDTWENGGTLQEREADWVVSFGHRHIIPPDQIARFPNRIINIHIAYLPHNKGADPNFWSWYDKTIKGVTIHHIDKGIDTGPILAQRSVRLLNSHTLRTSYIQLIYEAAALFAEQWRRIRTGNMIGSPQIGHGTYHRQADKDPWFNQLPLGWDTHCSVVEAMGEKREAA